jgi:hypothetical protein
VRYPNKSSPAGEVSQNVTANPTQRRRGGSRTRPLYEGVDPEIALIRVKLQSSLEHHPGNRPVIREASRLIVKWYSAYYGLDAITGSYLKTVVDGLLETAPLHHSAGPQGSQKQMADDETNRMYFNNLIGRPTYEREHLNLGKTGDSHKTNPSQLRRVSRPAPTARENTWQTNETNHAYVGVKRAAGNRLTYEKRVARLQKTSHSYKTNHPGFPHALPPMTSTQITTSLAYMPILSRAKNLDPSSRFHRGSG